MPLADNITIEPIYNYRTNQCAETVVTAWVDVYRGILSDGIVDNMTPSRMLQSWEDRHHDFVIAGSIEIGYGAYRDGELLGMVFGPMPPTDPKFHRFSAWMDLLYILPSEQGNGIGKALSKAFVEEVIRRGGKSMVLACLQENESSRNFYDYLNGKIEPEGGIWHCAQKMHYSWNNLPKLVKKLS